MKTAERKKFLDEIYRILFAHYGELRCPLEHASPYQLLVAVVLSGQCRDDRVNQVTPALFARYPDAAAMAEAHPEEVEPYIHACGLFRNKAANIVRLSQQLVENFAGEVPMTMEGLVQLAGVGRKSANVVLGNAFDLPGFPVDTHVKRVLNRLGAVDSEDPEKIEMEVNAVTEPERWANFSHMLIWHGRETCHARKPECAACRLTALCPKKIKKQKIS